jgi:hypothetical protein
MTNPITAWNNIGKKMNTHSIAGSSGPSEWMRSTRAWNEAAPAKTDEFVSKWTTRKAPTGTSPANEKSRYSKN